MQVQRQTVGYAVLERFLRKEFGRSRVLADDKQEGTTRIVGGQGKTVHIAPLDSQTNLDGVILDERTVLYPLLDGLFAIVGDADFLLMDGRHDPNAVTVMGKASASLIESLHLTVESAPMIMAA